MLKSPGKIAFTARQFSQCLAFDETMPAGGDFVRLLCLMLAFLRFS